MKPQQLKNIYPNIIKETSIKLLTIQGQLWTFEPWGFNDVKHSQSLECFTLSQVYIKSMEQDVKDQGKKVMHNII